MGKIGQNPNVSNLTTWESLRDYTSILLGSIVDLVSGNLSFQDNHKCSIIDYTFAAANTQYAITHGLGFAPSGYFLIGSSAATTLYNGGSTWTDKHIYLKASVATTVKIVIF